MEQADTSSNTTNVTQPYKRAKNTTAMHRTVAIQTEVSRAPESTSSASHTLSPSTSREVDNSMDCDGSGDMSSTLELEDETSDMQDNSRMVAELNFDTLVLVKGNVHTGLYEDNTFCTEEVLNMLKEAKKTLNTVRSCAYEDLQIRLNDFEDLGGAFRFNAAYLYANIDSLTDFPITNPRDLQGATIVEPNDVLYAVNTQGGNEGFVEYMHFKNHWGAKVYGYEFKKASNNNQIPATRHFPKESFEGWLGSDPDSMYELKCLDAFVQFVKSSTEGKGVHVVVSGGSEKTPGLYEGKKERRYKSIILAQVYIAMNLLRKNGTFVLRLFDMLTPYTVGLVCLIYRVFEDVKICRPEACYRGTADRFLVCKHFHADENCAKLIKFFADCVTFNDISNKQDEILELVPIETIKAIPKFLRYVCKSNQIFGRMQSRQINKICYGLHHRKDVYKLAKSRLYKIIRKSHEYWGCNPTILQEPRCIGLSINQFAAQLISHTFLRRHEGSLREIEKEHVLSSHSKRFLDTTDGNSLHYHFVPVGENRGIYLARGEGKVYYYKSSFEPNWELIQYEVQIDIPDGTLVYADIVRENTYYEDHSPPIDQLAFHIIDGMILGGKAIGDLEYSKRIEMCTKFAKLINKPSRTDLMLVRARPLQFANNFKNFDTRAVSLMMNDEGVAVKNHLMPVDTDDLGSPFYVMVGYLLMRTLNEGDDRSERDFFDLLLSRCFWKLDNDSNGQHEDLAVHYRRPPYWYQCTSTKYPPAATIS